MKTFQKNRKVIVQSVYIVTIKYGDNMEKLLITPKNLKINCRNVKITLKK